MNRQELYTLMEEAIALAEQEKKTEAIEKFRLLVQNTAKEPQIFYNAGIFFSSIGEHLEAADLFFRAWESEPVKTYAMRSALEDFHVGGGEIFTGGDFLAFDATYLKRSLATLQTILQEGPDNEANDLLNRVEQKIQKNRIAFKFLDGEYDFCRNALTRKKEMTNLDHRVMGFLNLIDSGEYDVLPGKFNVVLKSDLPQVPRQGFLARVRLAILGK